MLYRYEVIVHFYSIQDFTLMPSFVSYLFNAGFIFLNVMWNIFLHWPNKIEVAFCMAWRTGEVIWINCNKWEKKIIILRNKNAFFRLNIKTFFPGNSKKKKKLRRQNSFVQFSIFCKDVWKAADLLWNTRIYGLGWEDRVLARTEWGKRRSFYYKIKFVLN